MKENKLEELIKKLCPNGVEYKKLEDCCNILDNERKPVTKSARIKGEYPYYGANGIQDYVSDYIFDGTFVLVGEDGSVINKNGNPVVTWAEGKIWVNNHAHVIKEKENVLLRYLYHYIQTINVSVLIHGNIPKLNQGDFRNLRIAVPPLEVQCEIVHILDDFTLLSAELSAELEARQKQFKHYLNKVFIQENCEYKKLEEICEIRGRIGFRGYTKEDMVREGEGAISLTASNITRGYHTDYTNNTYLNWEKYEESPEIMVSNGDIILCQRGSIGKSAIVENLPEKATINPQLLLLKNIKCNNYYLALYFRTNDFLRNLEKITGHGTVQMIAQKDVKKLEIPVPTKERQKEIVNILNKLDKMCNDIFEGLPAEIEARQKQYEYYRDKLLTFKELKVNE